MQKYMHCNMAKEGTFTPFLVADKEIILTSVIAMHVSPGNRIVLQMEVAWEKPNNWDMGEIEINLRKDTPDGPVIYWTLESCFISAHTIVEQVEIGENPVQIYYLTVQSSEHRAVIVGPYLLRCTVLE
ncbi:hypothetical protein [Paenibacillus alginolyticus]|uniref:Uncharacterized protein n=1 Tax=Paenibacillus alginolyticus TaxID=59839 RepID=A0ABT4GE70_9BACL|nr:hypothetical protein [Paenibacillus alginolyticus]MCY9694368.1 hypothetical protein [Paenibacillus alginolyticus]MEC0147537.1 hypothetical protein [Paenibacillus alginolyticus]